MPERLRGFKTRCYVNPLYIYLYLYPHTSHGLRPLVPPNFEVVVAPLMLSVYTGSVDELHLYTVTQARRRQSLTKTIPFLHNALLKFLDVLFSCLVNVTSV